MEQQQPEPEEDIRVPLYKQEKEAGRITFCVTGAGGYTGGEIVRRLLLAGTFTVHGTVRGDPEEARYDGLRNLRGSGDRLKLFKADLSDFGAFDVPIKDCQAVIHVAAPVTVKVPRSLVQQEIISPAMDGVENIVRAIEQPGSKVKTLVMTSSVSAASGDNWERGKEHVHNEGDWNGISNERKFPYAYSKTLAEKKAWELYESQESRIGGDGKKWRLVTILPGFILGPPATFVKSEVVEFAAMLLQGKIWPFVPDYQFSFVDLSDVAAAHILVALDERAHGRYMLAYGSRTVGFATLLKAVQGSFKGYRFPITIAPKWLLWVLSFVTPMPWDLAVVAVNKPTSFDSQRITQDTDFVYHDPVKGLHDLLERILDLGMAPRLSS
eukprot:jgi/Picsp_1/3070/NSC_01292-R1_heme peroxidase-related protein